MRAIMAAGLFKLSLVYFTLTLVAHKFRLCLHGEISKVNTFTINHGLHLDDAELFRKTDEVCFNVVKFKSIRFTSRPRIRRGCSVWMKHGTANS